MIGRPIIMAIWQGKSKKKPTGGRLVSSRGKRRFEMSREIQHTKVGKESLKLYRVMGGNAKTEVLIAEYANVMDKKTNTVQRAKILRVLVNPADPNYVQRNIINKGAKINTELGDAVVTSRPGQDGAINAILVEKN
jgi:small subunit ribosomal protein S8e